MRPKIICHMVSSVDGRLLVDRWTPPASGGSRKIISEVYEDVAGRLGGDGWIVGRKSMEPMTLGQSRKTEVDHDASYTTYHGARKGRGIAAAIDPQGKLHYGRDSIGDEHFVAVLSHQVSAEYLTELREDGVSYLFAGEDGQDLNAAVDTLGDKFGIKTLLLEGGGVTNGAFLKAGLIDEISLLVYPGIDGLAGVPSIFEYLGSAGESPASGRTLRHLSTETLDGGFVWIRYALEKVALAVNPNS